jgi:hypothetical protein
MGTLQEDNCTFMVILRSVLLRRRNVSDKSCTENQKTQFISKKSLKNRVVYEITWKKIVAGQATDDNIGHAHCMLDT